jgi:hypothetical protein
VIVPEGVEQSLVGRANECKLGKLVMELNLLSALLPPDLFPSRSSLLCNMPTTTGSLFPLSPFFFFPLLPRKACENRERDCSFKELAGAGTMTVCERCTVVALVVVEAGDKAGELVAAPKRSAQRREPRSSGLGIEIASPAVAGLEIGLGFEFELAEKIRRRRECTVFFEDFVDNAMSFSPHCERGGVDNEGRVMSVEKRLSIFILDCVSVD